MPLEASRGQPKQKTESSRGDQVLHVPHAAGAKPQHGSQQKLVALAQAVVSDGCFVCKLPAGSEHAARGAKQ